MVDGRDGAGVGGGDDGNGLGPYRLFALIGGGDDHNPPMRNLGKMGVYIYPPSASPVLGDNVLDHVLSFNAILFESDEAAGRYAQLTRPNLPHPVPNLSPY